MNGAPNKHNIMYVVNVVLNEVPNSNDAIHVANNVQLTTMGTRQFSMTAI